MNATIVEIHRKFLAQAHEHSAYMLQETREKLVPALLGPLDAERIWVFGSVARGTATQDSDVDVFVECGNLIENVRFLDRLGIAINAKETARNKGFAFSSDIIVWTREELAAGISSNTPFWQTICKEGVLIYERRRTS